MPEMKTLNGYEIVDAKARAEIENIKLNGGGGTGGYVDLSNYATKAELPTKVSQLQNDSNFITREEVPNQDLSEYITESELNAKGYLTQHQSLAGYATEAFVTNKIAEAQLSGGSGNVIDLSGYATKDDIKNFITEVPSEYVTETELNSKGYLTQHQSLADYAKKSEIPDVSNFQTKAQVQALINQALGVIENGSY